MSRRRKPVHFPFSGVGTLLFSDVTGFSAAATGGIPPIDIIEAMARIFEMERRTIQAADGFMPYTGVAELMLAVWGPSFSNPSHADIALRVSTDILTELGRLQSATGFSLQVRIALTTGKMTAGLIGDRPQVFGAPFTTAKRLLELGIPRRSHVLFTSETLQHAQDRPTSSSIGTVWGCSGQDVPVFEFTV